MKITYNQIIEEFESFATSHSQISSFNKGLASDLVQHNMLTDFTYQLMFCQLDQPATMSNGEVTITVMVYILDLSKKGLELEILSDTLLTVLDTVAHFEKLYTDNWKFVSIQKTGTAQPYIGDFDDTITGWGIPLQFKQPLQYDECQIPNK